MKKTILIIVAVLMTSSMAFAQASVVQQQKDKLHLTRNLSPEQIHLLLREVAKVVHGGLFPKTQGNNCLGFSCDIICFAGQPTMYDVLGSSETDATPQWVAVPNDTRACKMDFGDVIIDPPPIDPPVNNDDVKLLLLKISVVLEEIKIQQAMQTAQQAQQTETLARAMADLKLEIAKGIKIRW